MARGRRIGKRPTVVALWCVVGPEVDQRAMSARLHAVAAEYDQDALITYHEYPLALSLGMPHNAAHGAQGKNAGRNLRAGKH